MQIPSAPDVKMVFAENLKVGKYASALRPLLVVAKPDPVPRYNSFGYKFQTDCYIILENGEIVSIFPEFMFAGSNTTWEAIAGLLKSGSGWIDASEITSTYCSLMSREDNYRDLVSRLGLELAVSVLRRLGDAVVVKMEARDDERLRLIESEPFALSMLRMNESWTAFRRAARHLRYAPIPEVEDAAVTFGMAVDLPSANNRYMVDFNFGYDRLIRGRLAVLTGRNGTGKSQLLLSLIDGLTSHPTVKLVPRERRVRFAHSKFGKLKFGAPTFSRVVVFSSTPSDLYPVSIPPWLGIDYQFFSLTRPVESGVDSVTASILDCWRDDERTALPEIENEHPTASQPPRLKLLKSILKPLDLWDGLHIPLKEGDASRQHTMIEWQGRGYVKVGRVTNEQKRLLTFRQIDLSSAPILLDRRTFHPRHLSSGEMVMFRFAAQASAAVETGSLFLFDEPETHLHPHFISDFVEILHPLLESTKSVAIAATHSAYLVREAPSRRVRILRVEDRIVSITPPRLQTFGAGIDEISSAVFSDFEIGHQYQSTLRKWVDSLDPDVTIEWVLSEFGREMNPETLSFIRRLLESREQDGSA